MLKLIGDIWRAGLPADRRGKTAWLPVLWWTCWLLAGAGRAQRASIDHVYWPHLAADTWTGSMCLLAVSAVTLIVIIRVVSTGPVGSPHLSARAELFEA